MIAVARTPQPGTLAVVTPGLELLAELDAQLRDLADISEDSYLFVVGQALGTASALLDVHARNVVS